MPVSVAMLANYGRIVHVVVVAVIMRVNVFVLHRVVIVGMAVLLIQVKRYTDAK